MRESAIATPNVPAPGRRWTFLLNRAAGALAGGGDWRERLERRIAELGLQTRLHWLAPEEFPAMLRRCVDGEAPDVLAVGGGDGTLNSAANALVDSSIALAPLPLGTFNHFAKDLGVPLLLEQALDALAAGRIRSIDVGEINGRVFLNNASLGIYPYAVRRRELARQQLGLRKLPAMGYALLGALWRLPMMNVLLRADDGHQELFKTPFVFIGNNQYRIAALAAVQRETLDRGRLSLFYTRRIGRLQLMRIAASTLLGGARPAPELEMRLTEAVELRFRRRTIKLAMDGEVVRLATPLTVRSRRGALKVVVPVA